MAQLRIIAMGKLKESYFLQAQAEYLKRLKPYFKLELLELPDLPCPDNASPAQEDLVRQKEATAIRSYLRPKDFLVTLDRQGKELSSPELADFLKEWENRGENLVLVIGGSLRLGGGVEPGGAAQSELLALYFSAPVI